MPSPPPISLADLPDEWYTSTREAMTVREGVPIRCNPQRASIDFFSVNRGCWMPLLLPGAGILFASFEERNEAVRRLQAKC